MTGFQATGPVLLVGAATADEDDFRQARTFADIVVAVDGGADTLAEWGETPDAVIGDMDSIRAQPPESATVIRVDEQDSTDLEKALREVSAPLYLGIGFLAGRLDHTLAAMHALVRFSDRPIILIGPEDTAFAAPTDWRATLAAGERISFYPVRRVEAVGSKGLRWPIDGLLMEGGRQIGTSNETVSANVAAWFAEPGAVTVLPKRWLSAVIDSLT